MLPSHYEGTDQRPCPQKRRHASGPFPFRTGPEPSAFVAFHLVAEFNQSIGGRFRAASIAGQTHAVGFELPEMKEKLVSVRVRDQQAVDVTDVAVILVLRLWYCAKPRSGPTRSSKFYGWPRGTPWHAGGNRSSSLILPRTRERLDS